MSNLKVQIAEIMKAFQTHQKIERHLIELAKKIDKENKQLAELTKKLDSEADDIADLEKMSLKSVFHKILGSKEEQIEKERQEYLQFSLKYDEAKKTLELLEYEREVLEKKFDQGKGLEAKLAQLLKRREQEVMFQNPKIAQQVNGIVQKVQQHERMIFEIEEALAVGKDAQYLLDQIVGYLNQAKSWGQWDMAGRQRHAGRMKHSQIDRAKNLSYKVKYNLEQFEKELKDVYRNQSFELNLTFASFSGFTDIFFDNLLTDWLVQQKIQNTLTSVQSVRDKVIRLRHSLQAEVPIIEEQIFSLEEKRQQLIANA